MIDNLPPLPMAFATLHHDDGYFTMPKRDDKTGRVFRTSVFTAEQMHAYVEADRISRDVPDFSGGGLVAIKTLLSRAPRAHATTAIAMIDAMLAASPQPQPVCPTCSGHGMIGGPSFYAPDEGGVPCPDCNQPQPVQEAPRGGNICLDCANADSWGVPDKRICQDCNMNSQWQPLNKSSKNPIQQTPHAAQPSEQAQPSEPIDMVLHCPACGEQHIDAPDEVPGQPILKSASTTEHPHKMMQVGTYTAQGEWTNPPHRSHLCHGCGHIWRPADVPTNGVSAAKTKGKADSPVAQPKPANQQKEPQ